MDRVIVVDIDHTLFSQTSRKRCIFRDIFDSSIDTETLETDFLIKSTLEQIAEETACPYETVLKKFEDAFFGPKYYEPELFSVYDYSNQILSQLNQHAGIIYLTSCNQNIRDHIVRILKENGFPNPESDNNQIIFADRNVSKLATFEQDAYLAKRMVLCNLLPKKNIAVFIGGRGSEAAAAYKNGIPSIVYSRYDERKVISDMAKTLEIDKEDTIDEYGIACICNWNDIRIYAEHCLGTTEVINEICKNHAGNYADWLSDLDQKSSLILVIATFCAAIFLNILVDSNMTALKGIVVPSFLGFITSLFSMYFAINSFSSRVTHGSELIRRLLRISLFHKDSSAPLTEQTKISETRFGATASAKYLLRRYGTLQRNELIGKNMISLRASNYTKIYPEVCARILLMFALFFMLWIGCCAFHNIIFNHETEPFLPTKYSIKTISNDVLTDENVYSFGADDFDDTMTELSLLGNSKITAIINSMGSTKGPVYVFLDDETLGLTAHDKIADYKRNIYLTIINEGFQKHQLSLGVILLYEN